MHSSTGPEPQDGSQLLLSRWPVPRRSIPPHRRAADNAAVPDTSKVCSAEEAVALIPDGVWLTPAGFVGASCPELLLNALRCAMFWFCFLDRWAALCSLIDGASLVPRHLGGRLLPRLLLAALRCAVVGPSSERHSAGPAGALPPVSRRPHADHAPFWAPQPSRPVRPCCPFRARPPGHTLLPQAAV